MKKTPPDSRSRVQIAKAFALLFALLNHADSALAAKDSAVASAVSATPTNVHLPGKLVWLDLVTGDVQKAATFYKDVFAWEIETQSDSGYLELSLDGRPIASVVAYDSDVSSLADGRWLVSISVDDADAAATRAIDAGGELLESVENFANRGRFALIRDTQGAILMLLDASGGDPADESVKLNDWGWAELWTDDVDDAVEFYRAVAEYESLDAVSASGEKRVILGSAGVARATVVPIPWPEVTPNWLPYLVVTNTVATLERINEAGGKILATQPEPAVDARVALVMDPTGGVFAIQQVESSR